MNRYYKLSYLSKVIVQFALLSLFTLMANGQSQAPADSLDPKALEQKIGQMIMVGIRGTHLNADAMELTRSQILSGDIGGIIFFKHNIKNSRQFRIFVKSLKALAVDQPLLLAVDEEGGKVRRLRKTQGFEEFPSAAHVGANLSTIESYDIYSRMANQIHQAGLNVNLAPVVDVNINRISPAIGQLNRSFSRNPGDVFDYSKAFIRAHNDSGVLTTLKHYPGHGSSREDSHNGITDISSTWRSSEQVPFQRLIDSAKVDMIMAGHLMDKDVDSKYPASISNSHIQVTLRDDMGYTGVVITDDLQMGAIIKRFELEEIVIAAINAGCDILQFSDPLDLDENLSQRIKEIVLQAIENGQVDPQRIHDSYARIVDLKSRLSPSPNPTSD
ncbi:MAG: glycoside hydrolase family 3 protein [Candidatus Marinimicrobia bacterium]|nr:glycoside hydrolase family 3 protein [Candidatus Neomarinimicrobiota bacterium]